MGSVVGMVNRFAYRRWGHPCEIDRLIIDLPDSMT